MYVEFVVLFNKVSWLCKPYNAIVQDINFNTISLIGCIADLALRLVHRRSLVTQIRKTNRVW